MLCQFLLYNKVNQLYVYIYPHNPSLLRFPPTRPIPHLKVVTKHGADLPVLCSCFPLTIYFTLGSTYVSMPLCDFVPAYPSPSPCPQVPSLRLCLYSCPDPKFFRNIYFSLDSIYMCQHTVFVFLFLIYFTLNKTLGPSTSPQITQFHSFLWLSSIPLYICTTSSLSIHLLMDTQVASMSWLLQIELQ